MKTKSLIISFLMLGALVTLTSASTKSEVKTVAVQEYTQCGPWSPLIWSDECNSYVRTRVCTHTEYDFGTIPPTVNSYQRIDVMGCDQNN